MHAIIINNSWLSLSISIGFSAEQLDLSCKNPNGHTRKPAAIQDSDDSSKIESSSSKFSNLQPKNAIGTLFYCFNLN